MSHTYHHDQKRWRPLPIDRRYGFWLPHAPGWFKHMLNRMYRAKANRELRDTGDVITKKPKGADWEWR